MQYNKEEVALVILSGGKSSRMGQEKADLDWQGKPMLEWIYEKLKDIASEYYLSSNKDSNLDVQVVKDIYSNVGPMGGLHAVLSQSVKDWNIIATCDSPLVEPKLYEVLIDEIVDEMGAIPLLNGKMYPLSGVYHRSLSVALWESIRDDKLKMTRFVDEAGLKLVELSEYDYEWEKVLLNLNTPEEYKKWKPC